MSDKLLQVGNIQFGPKVSIKSRGVRVVKRDNRTIDEKQASMRRLAISMMRNLRAMYEEEYHNVANEKSFDTETG